MPCNQFSALGSNAPLELAAAAASSPQILPAVHTHTAAAARLCSACGSARHMQTVPAIFRLGTRTVPAYRQARENDVPGMHSHTHACTSGSAGLLRYRQGRFSNVAFVHSGVSK